jgi:hypothetical protein
MPPKRKCIGRKTPEAQRRKILRASETEDQKEARLKAVRTHSAQVHTNETQEEREARIEALRFCEFSRSSSK